MEKTYLEFDKYIEKVKQSHLMQHLPIKAVRPERWIRAMLGEIENEAIRDYQKAKLQKDAGNEAEAKRLLSIAEGEINAIFMMLKWGAVRFIGPFQEDEILQRNSVLETLVKAAAENGEWCHVEIKEE